MQHYLETVKPLAFDLASTIVFAVLLATTGNIYLATGLGIALGIAQVIFQKMRGSRIETMQWMSLGLVVVFGTLTLYFQDPRFIMVKFTIVHVVIGIVMVKPNWMSRYLPQIVRDNLSVRELTIYSAMWPVLMFGLAIANLVVAFTMSQQAWTWFLATVPSTTPWLLIALQMIVMRIHVARAIRQRHQQTATAAAE